jgi:hypothetical protein
MEWKSTHRLVVMCLIENFFWRTITFISASQTAYPPTLLGVTWIQLTAPHLFSSVLLLLYLSLFNSSVNDAVFTWDIVALNYRAINEYESGKIGMEAAVSTFGVLPQYLPGRSEGKQRLDQSLHYVTVSRFEAGNLWMRSRNFEHLLLMFGAFPLMPILVLSPYVWLGLSSGLNHTLRQRIYMHFSPSPFHLPENCHQQ